MANARLCRLLRNVLITIGSVGFIVILITRASFKDDDDHQMSCHVLKSERRDMRDDDVKSIVFTQTTSHIGYRGACAVESAARHHPQWPVTLYNTTAIVEDQLLHLLFQLPNFKLEDLRPEKLFRHTPLRSWVDSGRHLQGPYRVEKLSDAIRLVLLWKGGGIYLDTDVIVLRSMAKLRNVIGLETSYRVNGAVMVFDKNSSFLFKCLVEFERHFSPFVWGAEGPSMLTKIVSDLCQADGDLYRVVSEGARCSGGVLVLPWHSFYPLPWPTWPKLFSVVTDYSALINCSYTIHMWNSMSKGRRASLRSKQLLDLLANRNCPKVYQLASRNFQSF